MADEPKQKKQQLEPKWMKARSTAQARRAIADFVNDNADNLADWLSQTAVGVVKLDENNQPIRDAPGSLVFVVKPDPAGAAKILADYADFVLPRLQRSDVEVVQRQEGQLDVSKLTTLELKQLVAERTGLVLRDDVIDVEPAKRDDPVPAWLEPSKKP